jgi:hypothetical protein
VYVVLVVLLLACLTCAAQVRDSGSLSKPDVLNSGYIDILTNGQINASARLIRLLVGEPGHFAIPVSIYSGVSSNNFQNLQNFQGRSNQHLINDFINPLSGLVNISFEGLLLLKAKKKKLTRSGFVYQAGEKVLTGYYEGAAGDPNTGKPVNFLSSVFVFGFYFQTGAWERNNSKNIGISWSVFRYILSYTGKEQLRNFLAAENPNGFYHGWSLGWGIEISNLVSIRILYYKYLKSPPVDYSFPICQVTFNYSVKK